MRPRSVHMAFLISGLVLPLSPIPYSPIKMHTDICFNMPDSPILVHHHSQNPPLLRLCQVLLEVSLQATPSVMRGCFDSWKWVREICSSGRIASGFPFDVRKTIHLHGDDRSAPVHSSFDFVQSGEPSPDLKLDELRLKFSWCLSVFLFCLRFRI